MKELLPSNTHRYLPINGWHWAMTLLLIVGTFIVFLPCLGLGFVWWDDQWYLLNYKPLAVFAHSWSWTAVYHFFTHAGLGNYIPLTTVTNAIEKYFFAPDPYTFPALFHFDNLLLHIGCTVCVFFLFLKMGLKNWSAFIGASLFAIHPMRVESVAWVTERKDVLYGFFFLMSLVFYTNYIHSQKRRWYLLAILLALLSCLAKVQAVSLPLSMLVLDIYFKRKLTLETVVFEKLPWWVFSIAFGLINVRILNTQHLLHSATITLQYNIVDKLAVGAYAYVVYLVKFMYPYQMCAYYPYPAQLPVASYVCLIALPVLAALLLWKQRENIALLFTVLFFTVNIMFVLQVFSAGSTFLADRFTYIAYVGLFFGVASACQWWVRRNLRTLRPVCVGIALYMLVLGITTQAQIKVWQNTRSLWAHYNKYHPNSAYGYGQLGGYYKSLVLKKFRQPDMHRSDSMLTQLSIQNLSTALQKDSAEGMPIKPFTAHLYFDRGAMYALSGANCAGHADSMWAAQLLPTGKSPQ